MIFYSVQIKECIQGLAYGEFCTSEIQSTEQIQDNQYSIIGISHKKVANESRM